MFAGAVGKKVWHLVHPRMTASSPGAGGRGKPRCPRVVFDDAEGIVCTGPFDEVNEVPEDYRPKFLLAKMPELLCANPDIVYVEG